jgi:rhamnosyltransferase
VPNLLAASPPLESAATAAPRVNGGISVVIPVCDAGDFAVRQVEAIRCQSMQPDDVIIIDSQSRDGSPEIFERAGFTVLPISRSSFDHGGTRNLAARSSEASIVIYLTQDAILRDKQSLASICAPFADPDVAIVCGRQLPRRKGGAIEKHARYFNYPPEYAERTLESAQGRGIRGIFNSNSFAAYRISAFNRFGQFPERIIMGEDQVAVARALLDGWKVAYAGDAVVEHSHNYSIRAEFRRYFDIGVFHRHHENLLQTFLTTSGEGWRFVKSEMTFLLHRAPLRIPEACLRTGLKLAGYQLGKRESFLPVRLKQRLGMNRGFWCPSGKVVERSVAADRQSMYRRAPPPPAPLPNV